MDSPTVSSSEAVNIDKGGNPMTYQGNGTSHLSCCQQLSRFLDLVSEKKDIQPKELCHRGICPLVIRYSVEKMDEEQSKAFKNR